MLKVAAKEYVDALSQPRHAHDAMSVSIVLRGTLWERVGRSEVVSRALDIVIKPAGVEHANRFGPGPTTLLSIQLSAAAEAELRRAIPSLGVWSWQRLSPAVPMFLALHSLRPNATPAELETAAYDALSGLAATAPRAAVDAPAWVQQVREQLDDLAATSVGQLAAAIGVHPVYLARQFRRFYGCSITEYLRRRRAHRAAQRLSGSCCCLSRVAIEAGYYDQPHLCRDFRRVTGMTPSGYRALINP